MDKVFNYFLAKDYLIRFFAEGEKENVTIASQYENPLLSEGETIKICFEEDEDIAEIVIKVIEVSEHEYIKTEIKFDYVAYSEDENEDEDFSEFFNKLMGEKMLYTISFTKLKNGKIKVNEVTEVFELDLTMKILLKIFGFFQKRKQMKIHKEVEKELKNL